ncbi:FecR domain-containing protein [Paramagnetospirillum magneticum]|uniref:FecR protein domain-containing protein n=1 Tax=Paramagnetospirillum magneticum (strain ATCC 700264 / AMB-1) TaxID=342108 RepID=Q2W1A0_PARM1|nr:FecR domain-containing protein [Paramagnetospirillum magneticum]BAE52375.1 hypothetical protein amb3571 [Paramagnetospirillum magneticum AMB-1]
MPVPQALAAVILGIILLASGALATEPAGKVIGLQGSAEARDGTHRRPLAAGDPIRNGESLHTGPGARLQVQLHNGMELTLTDEAPAAEPAGRVIRLQGSAEARIGVQSRPLAVGDPIRSGESLRTGSGARLLVQFSDGMELILSDGAEMKVATYEWNAAQAAGAAELALAQGSFLLRTGAVGKLPDHPLTVKTPLASVGVRGTQFWGGPLDAPLAVLLIDGRVVVTSPAGSVELGTPGEGTSVSGPGKAPMPPSYWGAERIGRAFATVGFKD